MGLGAQTQRLLQACASSVVDHRPAKRKELEPARLELATFCMPCRRAPNCAMAPTTSYIKGER